MSFLIPDRDIHFAAAVLCAALAYLVLMRHPRSPVHRVLAAMSCVLSVESLFNGLSLGAVEPDRMMFWQSLRLAASSLLPSALLTFVLMFGQKDPWEQVKRWRWAVLATLVLYPALASQAFGPFFTGLPINTVHGTHYLALTRVGYAFVFLFTLGIIPSLALMEMTLRAARGIYRWQVKFLVLGIIAYLVSRIFTATLWLLYRDLNLRLIAVNSGALILAVALIMGSFIRTRILPREIYVSPRFILRSITFSLVGLYFIAVGILAQVMVSYDSGVPLVPLIFLVLVAFLGLSIVLLSDRVRQFLKRFVARHFNRPLYDYRHIWEAFINRTSAVTDQRRLCAEAVRLISETLEVLSVNILLQDGSGKEWRLCGSTAPPDMPVAHLDQAREVLTTVALAAAGKGRIVDIGRITQERNLTLDEPQVRFLLDRHMRYFCSLSSGQESLGLLAMDKKVGDKNLTVEEEDLILTLASQIAGSLVSIRVSDQLREARAMETMQTFSAFFVHDLKNLSSKLSMTLQNLPRHFDNPEFREDALKLISQSVSKIDSMTGRISLLREKPEIHVSPVNLNALIRATLSELEGVISSSISAEYGEVPEALLDPEQIGKVLTNLVLNAHEAGAGRSRIRVVTGMSRDRLVLSVSDDGCGIPEEFLQTSLFKPFHTTKGKGLGIGLYQCRVIAEAHGGRIEVQSREGEGSTFTVTLPVAGR